MRVATHRPPGGADDRPLRVGLPILGQMASGTGFEHRALPYRGDDEFLDGTVPFVLEGLAGDGAVLAALGPRQTDLLQDALGPRVDRVEFVAMREAGRNPARIIPVWSEFVSRAVPGRPLRGIGEPVWPGRATEEIVECPNATR